MESSVILNSPILLGLLIVAFLIGAFDIKHRSSGYIMPLISILLCIGTTIYAMFLGASLYEAGTVFIIFTALNITSMSVNKGDNK